MSRSRRFIVMLVSLLVLFVVATTVTGQTQTTNRRQDRESMYEILCLLN